MHFLQSSEWESFQRALGRTVHRIGSVLAIEHPTPLGLYWYLARPDLDNQGLGNVVRAAKEAGALFIRIDPVRDVRRTTYDVRATEPTQPKTTLVLDLTPTLDELLASFHQKTRYNIKLAQKHGVEIEELTDSSSFAVAAFLQLVQRTNERQGIRSHPASYYKTMLETMGGSEGISTSVILATKDGMPLAANLMLWSDETAYYLHGASDHTHRALMAPYLLQWTCIKLAKQRGARSYDFWGIAPNVVNGKRLAANGERRATTHHSPLTTHDYTYNPSHPWAGITRFKLGFGGEVVTQPDSVDLVLDRTRHTLYTLLRRVRRTLSHTFVSGER